MSQRLIHVNLHRARSFFLAAIWHWMVYRHTVLSFSVPAGGNLGFQPHPTQTTAMKFSIHIFCAYVSIFIKGMHIENCNSYCWPFLFSQPQLELKERKKGNLSTVNFGFFGLWGNPHCIVRHFLKCVSWKKRVLCSRMSNSELNNVQQLYLLQDFSEFLII